MPPGLPGQTHEHAATRVRRELLLRPSADFPASSGRPVIARPLTGPLSGWVLQEHARSPAAAWLCQYDPKTWTALGVTSDQRWTFTPNGRHRPDLVAIDSSGRPVAACLRGFRRGQLLRVAGVDVRLRAPLDPIRLRWRLTDLDGDLARITHTAKSDEGHTLRFAWDHTPPAPALLTLLVVYSLMIEYSTRTRLFAGPAG